MQRVTIHDNNIIFGTSLFLWGSIVLLLGLTLGLGAYYSHISWLRYVAFFMLMSGVLTLFSSMKKDLDAEIKSSFYSIFIILFLLLLYFSLRTALPRFDFSVGDASDYYMAGVCSVTYSQDIGFFLPLTASVSGVGYSIFGIAYTPLINVLLYSASIPLGHFLFRRLGLHVGVAIMMSLFLLVTPLSIWFSKTSFSDPIWQLILLLFALLSMHITDKERPDPKALGALFLLLGLTPFLRGEAALLYGLVVFMGLYHLWKFQKPISALFVVSSFMMLIIGLYWALTIRSHYLLGWQFSRVIPHITAPELMNILYGAFVFIIVCIVLLSRVKDWFSRINLPLILTVLAIFFKVAIAYVYAIKKKGVFLDFFFIHEYGFILGNFGWVLSIGIVMGLLMLHYKAIKGGKLALTLVIMYVIFYIPFVMQKITFQDPHELFLYWNRYYFAILMMIHVFSLGLVLQFVYEQIEKHLEIKLYAFLLVGILLGGLSLFSFNTKVQAIVVQEAYLQNSYKIFPWLVKRVGNTPISVVYDSSVKYKRHNGMYDIKVFVARMFTVMKINAKSFQKISTDKLDETLIFNPSIEKSNYILCLSSKECHLDTQRFSLMDAIVLPISWREHYQAQPKHGRKVEGKIEDSLKNEVPLHVMLYKKK